ncbi:uncharacterized protein PFLUO_LOCUS9480 [Penicillium psychrofluorescens]|uniref:uncharacterized protein n=1 Tax=Penicillium psychrofluorescens TaxID=3158075 RepID=UPI003CCD23EE
MSATVGMAPPPPGVTPTFNNEYPWLYNANVSIIVFGLTISCICLGLRVWTRVYLLRKFGLDDASIIMAWLFSIGTQMTSLLSFTYGGVGSHMWNVSKQTYGEYEKYLLSTSILYVPALALAKISLIILYHRIMKKQKIYVMALHAITAVVMGYSISIIFALILACHPVSRNWDPTVEGECVNRTALYIATAVTNIVTDLALITLPIPLVLRLNMPRSQKVYLFLMFVVGCATVITSILRMVTLVDFLHATDVTYKLAWPELWINVEANLIIICPCLPILRPFMRHYIPGWGDDETATGNPYLDNTYTESQNKWKTAYGQNDEIALADNVDSVRSESRMVKSTR